MMTTANISSNATTNPATEQLDSARQELLKLPMLGPVTWLYARDPMRKFSFMADIDWRLLPPLVLNQCHIFHKQEVPWAYLSWAFVNETVEARFKSGVSMIAPHEWKSGNKPWLIDVVMPFGVDEGLIQQTISKFAPGQQVGALMTDPQSQMPWRMFHG